MPRRKAPGAVASIQMQLTEAANVFAREILAILRAAKLSDLTALAGKPAPAAGGSREVPSDDESPRRKRPSPRTSSLRRIAGTKPVSCPAPGCENPGVRSKMNFCNEHAASLSKAEKVKLRNQQRARHIAESIAGGPAQKAEPEPKGKKKAAKKKAAKKAA